MVSYSACCHVFFLPIVDVFSAWSNVGYCLGGSSGNGELLVLHVFETAFSLLLSKVADGLKTM